MYKIITIEKVLESDTFEQHYKGVTDKNEPIDIAYEGGKLFIALNGHWSDSKRILPHKDSSYIAITYDEIRNSINDDYDLPIKCKNN
jgi:hypothetical protein